MKTVCKSLKVASLWAMTSIQLEVLCKRGSHHGAHMECVTATIDHVAPCRKHYLAEKKVHATLEVDYNAFGKDSAEYLLERCSCRERSAAY